MEAKEPTEAQKLLDSGSYHVTDLVSVRRYLRKGLCSQEIYEHLTKVIAQTGCLIVPFKEHSDVRKFLGQSGR